MKFTILFASLFVILPFISLAHNGVDHSASASHDLYVPMVGGAIALSAVVVLRDKMRARRAALRGVR